MIPSGQLTSFGRFTLRTRLGEGGMAEVFLADMASAGDVSKVVVLKKILPKFVNDTGFMTMFLDEARLANMLSHPNVVQVFDFGESSGQFYLAMEYLPGETVRTLLFEAAQRGVHVPVPVTLRAITEICGGLHYAHTLTEGDMPLGIVHRDVSPSNIMLTYQGGIKLLDFGVARAANRQQEETQTGLIKGKLPYCAPEQLDRGEVDPRTDVFALGVVCHEMLTGRRLFRRETEVRTMNAVLHETVPPPSAHRPGIPPGLDDVVLTALERDWDKRFASAQEFRRALERFMDGPLVRIDDYMRDFFGEERAKQAIELTTPGTSVSGSFKSIAHPADAPTRQLDSNTSFKRQRRRWYLLAAAVAFAFVGLGGWFASTSREELAKAADPSMHATLRVESIPPGAAVEVIGRTLETPATFDTLPQGDLSVKASLEGYRSVTKIVSLTKGQTQSVVIEMVALATLTLHAPEDAEVTVDGKLVSDKTLTLTAGTHEIRASAEGRKPFSKSVRLEPGGVLTLDVELPKARRAQVPSRPRPARPSGTGVLDVACIPWCRVIIDGKDVGRPSPIVGHKIPAGAHDLRLEHPPSGAVRRMQINLTDGERVRKKVRF